MLPLTEQIDYAILTVMDEFDGINISRTLLTSIVQDYGYRREDIDKRVNLMLANGTLRMINDGNITLTKSK